MPDKEHTQPSTNQQETNPVNENVVQEHLEQYHQLASELRGSKHIDQAVLALEPLVNIAHTDQIIYLKALGRENSSDAADIAQAMYHIAPDKEVRKEARRTLLRLEAQNIYPRWNITPEGQVFPSIIELTTEDFPDRERPSLIDQTPFSFSSIFQEVEDFFESLTNTPTTAPVNALLRSLGEGDPEDGYNALSPDSPLREGLDAETWIERRTQWSEAAATEIVQITYIGEKERLAPDRAIVEATWSLPIRNPEVTPKPIDLPVATCILEETGRHWYWTSYMVVEENGEWHIIDMTDEGARAVQLPPEEIDQILEGKAEQVLQRLAELEDEDEEDEDFEDFDDEELEDFEDEDEVESEDLDDEEDEADLDEDEEDKSYLEEMDEVILEATQALHYYDALIRYVPDADPSLYENAVQLAQAIEDSERTAVYFRDMAEHVPEARGRALRNLAVLYEEFLEEYLADNPEDPEPEKQRYNALIERTLRQAIDVDQTADSYILLADHLIHQNKNLDEAEMLLRQVQLSATEDEDIISIEAGLAHIAQNHDQKEEALQHYQTVARLDPDFPHIWLKIGSLQRQLGDIDEAIFNLRRSVKEEPDLTEAYMELSLLYSDQKQFNKARDILRKGLDKFPDSVDLLASLSIVYTKSGDLHSAQRYLQQAERLDEQNSFVPLARAMLQVQKEQKATAPRSAPKDRQQAKHRSHKHKKK
jgi:tetratricopeptide (TPR) repeat protein